MLYQLWKILILGQNQSMNNFSTDKLEDADYVYYF